MTSTEATNNHTSLRPILFGIGSARGNILYAMVFAVLLSLAGCSGMGGPCPIDSDEAVPAAAPAKKESPASPGLITEETSLFDGKTLGKWAVTDFGGQGEVVVKDGAIYMAMGHDMTGITWTGPLIRMDYEISHTNPSMIE